MYFLLANFLTNDCFSLKTFLSDKQSLLILWLKELERSFWELKFGVLLYFGTKAKGLVYIRINGKNNRLDFAQISSANSFPGCFAER